jgi:hypothetical protein
MTKNTNPNIFPFNEEQLAFFQKEINEAGSFEELMIKKGALNPIGEVRHLITNRDKEIEEYRQRFLTGVYESLRDFFDIEVPYAFWSDFYDTLMRWENGYK